MKYEDRSKEGMKSYMAATREMTSALTSTLSLVNQKKRLQKAGIEYTCRGTTLHVRPADAERAQQLLNAPLHARQKVTP
jgi:tRNA(Phe) wybutosine-synthesizing methylase Tyw3